MLKSGFLPWIDDQCIGGLSHDSSLLHPSGATRNFADKDSKASPTQKNDSDEKN